MVSTVNPNANATPSSPIPTSGNPDEIIALPHPPNVSQKVPMASAAYLRVFILPSFCLDEAMIRIRGSLRQAGHDDECLIVSNPTEGYAAISNRHDDCGESLR